MMMMMPNQNRDMLDRLTSHMQQIQNQKRITCLCVNLEGRKACREGSCAARSDSFRRFSARQSLLCWWSRAYIHIHTAFIRRTYGVYLRRAYIHERRHTQYVLTYIHTPGSRPSYVGPSILQMHGSIDTDRDIADTYAYIEVCSLHFIEKSSIRRFLRIYRCMKIPLPWPRSTLLMLPQAVDGSLL
jgi:hypothetical protein